MEQNKEKRELDENDFWNCKNAYYVGTCRCKVMGGNAECLLTKGANRCSNFEYYDYSEA